jgi:hypothetical protein
MGGALALVLILALLVTLVPASSADAQAFSANRFNRISTPSPGGSRLQAGSDITDFAINGSTIYIVSQATATVYKSTNGGISANALGLPAGMVGAPKMIAVAPDNPGAVAMVEAGPPDIVWISTNGGATWSAMAGPWAATEVISDIAVSPARSGTILGRDYTVSTYDPQAIGVNTGDIYVIGQTAAWVAVATGAGLAMDFTSVAMAPNWVGDRVVVGVGSGGAASAAGNVEVGGAAVGDSYLVAINVATGALAGPAQVLLDAAGADSPAELTAAPGTNNGEMWASDIALPSDFDSTSVAGFRVYLGWTSTPLGGVINCADDAYRVDFNTVRKLEVRPAVGIYSISYHGTVASGKLMVGQAQGTSVWFTGDPQTSLPTWDFAFKNPTGPAAPAYGMTVVALVSDTDAYAGASGNDTAFSKTVDGGLSFNGMVIIDEAVAAMDDVIVSPDGSTFFLATNDGAGNYSLWRAKGYPNPGGWQRVAFRNAAQFTGPTTLVRLSPAYGTDSTLFWYDTGSTAIRRSTNEGHIWGGRTAPAPVVDAAIESADVQYVIDNAGNVYSSTNGAWFFDLPVNAAIGGLMDIEMCPNYPHTPVAGNVIVGGVGQGIALSTDSGATWRSLLSFFGAAGVSVAADDEYATNNTVFAADNTGGSGVWRYVVGESNAWEQVRMVNANEQMTGVCVVEGVIYASWVDAVALTSGIERSISPTSTVAAMGWETMNVGVIGGAAFNIMPNGVRAAPTNGSIAIYAIDTNGPNLMAYEDTMALSKPELTVPETVPIDSVSGRSTQFTISWGSMSNADTFDIRVYSDPAKTQQVWASNGWLATNAGSPAIVVPAGTLVAGNDYFVRVRARNQVPNDGIRSGWSSVHRFSAEAGERVEVSYLGPQPLGPAPGSTGVLKDNPGFTWSSYAKATRYEFQLSSDSSFSNIIAEGKVSATGYKYEGSLDYGSTYFWRVRGIEPTTSDWSPVSSFSTEKAPPPPEPAPPPPPEPAPPVVTPTIIWAIIGIGAVLVIAVIVLIVRTRTTR